MFCGGELAARIERVETSAIVGAARVGIGQGVDGFVREVGGGAACFAGVGSPLNKVVGVGFGGVPSVGEWEAIEEAYARAGCPVQVELSQLGEPRIAEELTGRGYRLMSFENVLGMPLDGGGWVAPDGVEVRLDAGDDLGPWLDVVVDGFAHPDDGPTHEEFPREAIAEVMRNMASANETRRYIAYRDGVAAGGASMRTDGGIAALAGAATLPTHRRRGVQTALLTARLIDAAEAGCDLATVTTAPGSKSQQNAQGRGFSLLYTRAILVKEL
ncbi:GNAT family N-acetyltransferase [Nocardia rosealba]|uniref:GNAT family N-acetyltransferase n=1 Tax=Nocardia TaxID=1817 RepID=UPI001CD9DD67|nr:GNAT family N-acetyltransferase [Nocardia rosealba]MCA2209427.1 GNAT family N-acetyltransferase [Nocardia rosealba]